jgi:NADH dehydrogenase
VTAPPSVVVVGGGFGGLEVCKALSRHARAGAMRLTLIDKENFFQFNPLLPEVATGAVETRHIVYPLRAFCAPRGIHFLRNKVRRVDAEARVLHLHNELEVPYDYLVVAAGSSTNWFGVPGAERHGFPFKTLMDAIRLRAHVVEMWELADQATSTEARRQLLTFVVVGGGITGVEVCASLVDMFRKTMAPLYRNVPLSLVSVHLVEAGDRLLPGLHPRHSEVAGKHLRTGNVNVLLHRRVTRVLPERVELDDGSVLAAHTLVWTTGIRGAILDSPWPWPTGRLGRLSVDLGCRVEDRVWAIGDTADLRDAEGAPVPNVSQGAMQSGRVAAANLLHELGLGPARELRYVDLGYVVGLGRHSTVARVLGIPLAGWMAWYFWALLYMVKMVGFRKQLEVAIDIVKGLLVTHDTSQIHERRRMLRERDLDPELGDERQETGRRS